MLGPEGGARTTAAEPERAVEPTASASPDRWASWVTVGLVLLPLVVSAAVLLLRVGPGFHALSDNAQNEILTRDVGRHLVLLGPYSRDGWNHLGPAMYYLLALPYRLTGSNSVGMYIGALLINAVAVAGIVIIGRRRGGLPVLLLTALGVTVVMQNLGGDFLRDPWNPYVTVLPFGLFVFLVWELAAGTAWALPVAAAVGTFLVQTHVGYVPLAVPLLLGGAVWLVVIARRSPNRGVAWPRVIRAGIVSAVILLVMWTPPLVGVVQNTPGNLRTAAHFFLSGQAHHSLLDGYRVVAEQFSARPEWLTGGHTPDPFTAEPDFIRTTAVPWLILPFVLAVWVLWRRRVGEALRLAAIVAVTSVLGVLAVSRTVGPVFTYRLRWTWLLGMFAIVLVGWALWVLASRSAWPRRKGVLLVPIVLAIVGFTVANTATAARSSTPQTPESLVLADLYPQLLKALPHRRGVVVVLGTSYSGSGYKAGTILWLEHDGIAARTFDTADAEQGFGSSRIYHHGPIRAIVTFGSDSALDGLANDPRQHLVAYQGKVPPGRRARLVAELAALNRQQKAGLISKAELLARSIALSRQLGHTTGAFLRKP